MKKLIVAALIAGFGAFAWWSLPGVPRPETERASGGHADHGGDPAALADGVVLSVERTAANVTISHGPIPNLGMPGMTMGFRVGDPALLERIKPGDKVKFHADVVGGEFTVMTIEAAN
jgi:Cu(I)/Ag(I) efflux system periplasmic protein CusF